MSTAWIFSSLTSEGRCSNDAMKKGLLLRHLMGMGTAFLIFMPGEMTLKTILLYRSQRKWKRRKKEQMFADNIIRFVDWRFSSPAKALLSAENLCQFSQEESTLNLHGDIFGCWRALHQCTETCSESRRIICAPRGAHFDAYRNKLIKTWRPGENKHPAQKFFITWKIFWINNRMHALKFQVSELFTI